MKTILKQQIQEAIKEKEHLIYLYENSPATHTGEKKIIPELQEEIEILKERLTTEAS